MSLIVACLLQVLQLTRIYRSLSMFPMRPQASRRDMTAQCELADAQNMSMFIVDTSFSPPPGCLTRLRKEGVPSQTAKLGTRTCKVPSANHVHHDGTTSAGLSCSLAALSL